ncbi:MAG: hypothetical protein JO274_12975 [Gammaproteobacteria bacterium]|nr:hypothetical protein [Gammaproteobacteria bacterium]
MTTFVPMPYSEVTCAAAAALITLLLSATFVQSTSLPPGSYTWPVAFGQIQPERAWFGQPEPAVLVD